VEKIAGKPKAYGEKTSTPIGQDVKGYFTPEEWSKSERDDVSLEEVRQALSTISGSLSEAVIALRQER